MSFPLRSALWEVVFCQEDVTGGVLVRGESVNGGHV